MPSSRLRTATETPAVDALVAGALALAVQAEVWTWWVEAEQGPIPVAAAFGLAVCVPLLWRRRRPLPALVGTVALYALWVAAAPPRGSIAPFLVVLAAVYAVAAHGTGRQALAGVVLGLAAEVLFVARTTNDLADYGFILTFLVGAWLAGRGMRVRQDRADELFRRAVRAEVEREAEARAAVAEERGRIARELHDIISHSVSVMVVQAGGAEQVLERDLDQVRACLQAIQRTGRDTRTELGRLLGVLRTGESRGPGHDPQPGLAELTRLADRLRASGTDLTVEVAEPPRPVPVGLDLAAYRIAQEAVTNALKHSAGCRVSVRVGYGRGFVDIEVLDDGGSVPEDGAGGFGLAGMQERTALYGGVLEHGRRPGGGYRVHARLPLPGGDA